MTSNLLDQQNDDQVQIDESKNYLEELVGPGKKFATVEDMAKGKYISDEVIKIKDRRYDLLEEDYKKIRDENIAGPKLQELIDQNETLLQQLTSRENTMNSNEGLNKVAAYDPKQVESLVDSRVQAFEQTRKEEENFNLISKKLKEQMGNTYSTVLKDKADALGLSDSEVNSMARRNPSLFIKTFDLDSVNKNSSVFQAPPKTSTRNESFAPTTSEKRDWVYYLKLKEKDPRAWENRAIRIQMDKDALALGKDFYET